MSEYLGVKEGKFVTTQACKDVGQSFACHGKKLASDYPVSLEERAGNKGSRKRHGDIALPNNAFRVLRVTVFVGTRLIVHCLVDQLVNRLKLHRNFISLVILGCFWHRKSRFSCRKHCWCQHWKAQHTAPPPTKSRRDLICTLRLTTRAWTPKHLS